MSVTATGQGDGLRWMLASASFRPRASARTDARAFHRRLPGYEVTPLLEAPALAERLGVGRVAVKMESARLGLPSFKILGASWAIARALGQHVGASLTECTDVGEMARLLEPSLPLTLVAATDGNHGRAVAHMAAWLGLDAHIIVPAEVSESRRAALRREGARVTVVDGPYDDAVDASKAEAGPRSLVISDTSWPGYESVPRWISEGYSTIFAEVADAWDPAGRSSPDVVAVQIGVGALAAAVVDHYRQSDDTRIVGVEPDRADCVARSVAQGQPISLTGGQDSIMAGLNCGTPSRVAWSELSTGLDAYVVIADEWARRAVRTLADAGIVAGESGAAGLAGLMALGACAPVEVRTAAGLCPDAAVLVLATEGATDPEAWAAIVGSRPEDVVRPG